MVAKKKKKIILISIISVLLVAVIAISGVFIVRKRKSNNGNNAPTANQTTDSVSNMSNMAIADGKVSSNYIGVYKFNTIKNIEYGDELLENKRKLDALFKNKGVKNENELFDLLKRDKKESADKGELIVISVNEDGNDVVGNIHKVTGGIKNPKPILGTVGTFVGDDNLSLVTLVGTKEQYYISLNYKSKSDAIEVSDASTNTNGTKLYVFERIYSSKDPNVLLINIVYEYDLVVYEEDINDSIYDF